VSGSAVLFMILVCSVIWGGFAVLLVRMVWSEGRKRKYVEE
jgi:hypothetical protein